MSKVLQITAKAARVNAGLSLDAAASALGISRYSLANYEAGVTVPKLDTVQQMETLYGIPMKHFFFPKRPEKMDENGQEAQHVPR